MGCRGLWGCCLIAHRPPLPRSRVKLAESPEPAASCSKKTMRQNSKESMGTQQPVLTTVLMMGGWIASVIPGIVYGIRANRGEWAA
jgi:hypothetical protein